jgi:nicotinamidase-related amidase
MEKFFLDRNSAALLIIDIQEKLAAVMKMKDAVIGNCLHLIELSRMLGIPIILTEQYSKGLGPTVEAIRNALPDCRPIEKLTFSCCDEPSFTDAIRQQKKKTLIVTGMETHICILQTSIGLLREGYHVHLVKDAVCSRTKENWKIACEFLRDAGGIITGTETVLFQLLKIAGTEEFKAISKRIK